MSGIIEKPGYEGPVNPGFEQLDPVWADRNLKEMIEYIRDAEEPESISNVLVADVLDGILDKIPQTEDTEDQPCKKIDPSLFLSVPEIENMVETSFSSPITLEEDD